MLQKTSGAGFENGSAFAWSHPWADFDFVTNGLTVTFLNNSFGAQPLSCFWILDDGTNSSLCDPPQHTYGNPRTYFVRLTVTNSVGTHSVDKQVTVSN